MAKFCGKIGYAETTETSQGSGIWQETITEQKYYGDLVRNSRSLQGSGNVNDNVVVSNNISIVADQFAIKNFHKIRYVEFMGAKWKISDIEVQHPRLILTLGDLYNG